MIIDIRYGADEMVQIVAAAERRNMTVSEYIRSASLAASRRHSSRAERDEEIEGLHSLGWSNAEIAVRLGISRETVGTRLAAGRHPAAQGGTE